MYLIERSGKFIREILHLLLDRTSFIKCRSRRLAAHCTARAVRSWRRAAAVWWPAAGPPWPNMRTRARTYVARRARLKRGTDPARLAI